MADEKKINVDKQGRICDKQGRPLRDRRLRNYGKAPFMGKPEGKPHPRAKKLEARQEDYDNSKAMSTDDAYRRPGSVKKS